MSAGDSGAILENLKSLFPKSIDLTLDRPKRLLADLGHPERSLPPVVHIAGTNGKGSTLAMLRAGMEAAGMRVHAYVSPHLAKFHERIRLSGKLIGEAELVDVLRECEQVNKDQPITLFEITTCASFLAFARSEADALLLEVGLGGRLDATNVVEKPALTVISPVSLDHQQHLGDTLPRIASEKAGILKPGVPCVVSRQDAAALRAISETARAVGAPLLVQDRDWSVRTVPGGMEFRDGKGRMDLPKPNLVGPHQVENAGAAIAALRQLEIDSGAIEAAVSKAEWPARMQRLSKGPLVEAARGAELWLDGGHNPAAGAALAKTLMEMPAKTTRLICGMLDTKDARGFLSSFRSVADRLYGIAIPGESASLAAGTMAAAAAAAGIPSESSADAEDAARRIASERPGSRILVCGSLYLAGRVLQENG